MVHLIFVWTGEGSTNLLENEGEDEAAEIVGYLNAFFSSGEESEGEVSDVLGREVTTLVNEQRPAGDHGVTWDASSKPSGVYFYRLQSCDFIQVKRMILMQ